MLEKHLCTRLYCTFYICIFNFLHIFTTQYCCKAQLSDVHNCIKTSGRFKINTITWCTKIHDFILVMLKNLISGCSKCSSFDVIRVFSGVDDLCTVLANQPVTFFSWKDSRNAHPQQLQCTSLRRCDRSVAQAPKLHPYYNESLQSLCLYYTKHERRRCK